MEELKKAALRNISDCGASLKSELHQQIVGFNAELEKAGIARAETAKLEYQASQIKETIRQAQVFTGIMYSEEALKQVPPTFVIQILERIQLYIILRWRALEALQVGEHG